MSDHTNGDESPWMGSVGIGIVLLGIAGGLFAVHLGAEVAHIHALNVGALVGSILIGFYGLMGVIAGLVNSSVEASGDGHDDHGDSHDEHAHHGSFSPILMAFGLMLFLYGFVESYLVLMLGLLITFIAIFNWWREDYPNDGKHEMKSLGQPYGGMDVRKVGIWIFLMSECMVFGSFFSSYLRMRLGWTTHWDESCDSIGEDPSLGVCSDNYVIVASEYVTHNFWTLLPGAINTFALILSSYTVVLALKYASASSYVKPKTKLMQMWMPDQRRAVRNNLVATLILGTLFLVLKLVEWDHLINDQDFTIKTSLAASIFYVSTGAHGFHVFVGLIILCFFCFKAQNGGWDEDNAQSIEYFGLYWHFVDLAWVAIFPAFYLY